MVKHSTPVGKTIFQDVAPSIQFILYLSNNKFEKVKLYKKR